MRAYHRQYSMDLNNGKRLNDTERRTWKNKSEKLPMGTDLMMPPCLAYYSALTRGWKC